MVPTSSTSAASSQPAQFLQPLSAGGGAHPNSVFTSQVQNVVYVPGANHPEGATVQCTYISIPQVAVPLLFTLQVIRSVVSTSVPSPLLLECWTEILCVAVKFYNIQCSEQHRAIAFWSVGQEDLRENPRPKKPAHVHHAAIPRPVLQLMWLIPGTAHGFKRRYI